MVQKFRETAENPMKEKFRDKNFVIATYFRDYRRAATPVRTIHVVALPTTARGSQCEDLEKDDTIQVPVTGLFLPLAPSTVASLATSST